jgi:methylenetetrahydrofolate dehydrogenase (NADP+)/methenyltetrahydrofolate cyclohydrolase
MPEARLIDGKARAALLTESVKTDTEALVAQGVRPGLAVVIVGDDPASQVYVRNKQRIAEQCGFLSLKHTLDADISQDELLRLVQSLNDDARIHGILVQLPLPKNLDEQIVTQSILPGKDVDGFHFENIGRLTAGHLEQAFVPCTPAGCMLMIEDELGKDLSGLNAVVVGRSNIVGKPMASLLMQANATVTICHSRTADLADVVRRGDIVIAAVGRPNMIEGSWIKPGAIVIDVGINRVATTVDGESRSRLTGDVDFASARPVAAAITPVPGGVGPMTIAMLMVNTLRSAQRTLTD